MDRGALGNNLRNGNDNSMASNCKDELEEDRETVSLLPPSLNGGAAAEREKKNSRRKVQWNDRNGNKLVQVLEFQPSDSSDSEDEGEKGDCCCCTCSLM